MTTTPIAVRQATPDDIDHIAKFQQKMALETEGKALNADLLRKGVNAVFEADGDKGFYLVADIDDETVGSLLMTFEWSDWRNATFWWIQSVYVDAAYRRRGVYKAMYDHIYSIANERDDICGIRLYVERENHIAQQTYTSLGMDMSHYDLREVDFVL